MYKLGEKSLLNLASCDMRLQLVAHAAINIYDFSVIEGGRTLERQKELYDAGKSWTLESMHLIDDKNPFSKAFDLVPYPMREEDWHNRPLFCYFGGIIMGVAKSLNIPLRWGGDWDQSNNPATNKKFDGAHFELIEI